MFGQNCINWWENECTRRRISGIQNSTQNGRWTRTWLIFFIINAESIPKSAREEIRSPREFRKETVCNFEADKVLRFVWTSETSQIFHNANLVDKHSRISFNNYSRTMSLKSRKQLIDFRCTTQTGRVRKQQMNVSKIRDESFKTPFVPSGGDNLPWC